MFSHWHGGSVTRSVQAEANQHCGTGISPVIINKTKEQRGGHWQAAAILQSAGLLRPDDFNRCIDPCT